MQKKRLQIKIFERVWIIIVDYKRYNKFLICYFKNCAICVFLRRRRGHFYTVCWIFDPWLIQRSWCQEWGRRLHRWCHWSLFSLLTTTHTRRERTVTFCKVSAFSPQLDWDKEEDEYPVSARSSEHGDRSAYLGKLIDWGKRWWWEKGRKAVEEAKTGGSVK